MKKGLIFIVIIGLIAAGAWYALSGAGDFIRAQIEKQGSQFLGTTVSVASVDLSISEGRMSINDIDVENPKGYSQEDAFSLETITLDLGEIMNEPYVVQEVSLNAPEVLYEVDANGKGNLLVLKDNLMAQLPKSESQPASKEGANPLVIIENVVVSNVRLKFNLEKLSTGDLDIEKTFDITLPTFNAGAIGKPNGIPADQAGGAIVKAMLDNIIREAKAQAKKRVTDKAKALAEEKLEEEKDKLVDKAKDKLKDILNR